jgi:hypothetical protein
LAQLGISEFTFGFAFLYEQTTSNWGSLQAAPVLPSLQKEADLGWDAKLPTLGSDYYFQFKLADRLERGNAKYIKDGTYTGHYYRIALHRRDGNHQHRRLRLHAQSHPDTYYVAPEVQNLDEFNTAFLARTLTQRSRLIPISQCLDQADDEQHYITFQEGSSGWREHSKPHFHESSYLGKDSRQLFEHSRARWRDLDVSFSEELFESVRQQAKLFEREESPDRPAPARELLESVPDHSRPALLRRTADILAAYMGLTLVLVGSAE